VPRLSSETGPCPGAGDGPPKATSVTRVLRQTDAAGKVPRRALALCVICYRSWTTGGPFEVLVRAGTGALIGRSAHLPWPC